MQVAITARKAGIRTVLARIGVVFSLEGGALATMLPAFRRGVAGRMGSGEQVMSWIHLDDVVPLLAHALVTPGWRAPSMAARPIRWRIANSPERWPGRCAVRPRSLSPPPRSSSPSGRCRRSCSRGNVPSPRKGLASGFTFAHPTLDEALGDLLARRAA